MASIAVDAAGVGIAAPAVGFGEAQVEKGRISVFDHGAVALMRRGHIRLCHGRLRGLEPSGARLADGAALAADAVVLATGFVPRYEELLAQPERFLAVAVSYLDSRPLSEAEILALPDLMCAADSAPLPPKNRKFIFHSRKNVDDFWLKF